MTVIQQELNGCMAGTIGANGLSAQEYASVEVEAKQALRKLDQMIAAGRLSFADDLTEAETTVSLVEETYARLTDGTRTIMFFGCGEAGLIGQAIAQFAGWGIPGVMVGSQRKRPVTRFYSNPDPVTMAGALARSDLDRTRFVLTSKDGDLSTISQALAAIEAVRQSGHGNSIPQIFLTITGQQDHSQPNGLRSLADHLDIPSIAFPAGIDERFSALTVAGLLPAAARGLNIREILEGAKDELAAVRSATDTQACNPAQAAATSVALGRYRGAYHQTFLPADDRLTETANLWAHMLSTGAGNEENGQSASTIGRPLDQYNLLQSFAGNAQPCYVTLIHTSSGQHGHALSPELAEIAGMRALAGQTLESLAQARQTAIVDIIKDSGLPTRILQVPQLNERALGSLLMQMMLESILTALMLDRDPFQVTIAADIDRNAMQALQDVHEQ